jgi:hypothetical protein
MSASNVGLTPSAMRVSPSPDWSCCHSTCLGYQTLFGRTPHLGSTGSWSKSHVGHPSAPATRATPESAAIIRSRSCTIAAVCKNRSAGSSAWPKSVTGYGAISSSLLGCRELNFAPRISNNGARLASGALRSLPDRWERSARQADMDLRPIGKHGGPALQCLRFCEEIGHG